MRGSDVQRQGDRGGRRRGLVALAAVVLLAGPAAAQIPDEFENLQVLPKDIEKRQLVEVMKSFCGALAVRCVYCHVGEEGAPLSEVDFVSDDNHHKDATRVMMRMVDAINGTHLPELGEGHPELEVRCVTCHHGQTKPRSLEQVLAKAVADDGVDGALAKYKELRERHYGGFTFDFSAGTLANLATQLARQDQNEAAIAFLELNAEHYPDAAISYFYLGDLYARTGAKDKAIENLEKALELNPRNPMAKRKLEELKGG